jgi:hypothetical protein
MRLNAVAVAAVLSFASCAAWAQVPVVVAPGFATDPMEAIGSVGDANVQTGLGTYKKLLTVPAGRNFRLTDLSLVTRRANTSTQPCVVELYRGNDTAPTAPVWSRIKLTSLETYDRSWNTPPSFAAGESVWIRAFFDPFNAGLRLCSRVDINNESEILYAVRGYLVRTHGGN